MKNLIKEGFGVGIGMLAAFAVYIFVGLIFFIPGFVLFTQEQKKHQKNTSMLVISAILMLIGVVIMGGLGLGVLLNDVSEIF